MNLGRSFKDIVTSIKYATTEYLKAKASYTLEDSIKNLKEEDLIRLLFRYRNVRAQVVQATSNKLYSTYQVQLLTSALSTGDQIYTRARKALRGE